MTDSVQVFDPGFRVTDTNGDPVNNAKIKFREIGPGTVKTVYSDATLSTSLGNIVRTRSDGYPVVTEGSNTTVLIYVGSDPYYIEITDENDVAIFPAKDNVKGAVDTSTFLVSGSTSTLEIPVISKTSDYTVLEADRGKLISANPSGGFFTITLPSAITVGDGWSIEVRNIDVSNPVGIAASQSIDIQIGDVTAFAMRPGESVWLKSNGVSYIASAQSPAYITGAIGIIRIADRLSTPPVSPTAGGRYIVGTAPTGVWSTFAEHDIAESNGQAGWIRITPVADCGWIAYVEDENMHYRFLGAAWVAEIATDAEILAGTETAKFASVAGLKERFPQQLASGTVASAATLDIVLTSFTGYKFLELHFYFLPATDAANLFLRYSTDGGANYDASGYNWASHGAFDVAAEALNGSGSDTEIQITADGVGNAATEGVAGTMRLFGPTETTLWTKCTFLNYYINDTGTPGGVSDVGGGSRETAQNTDAIRLLFSSGDIASGEWTLIGYPQ